MGGGFNVQLLWGGDACSYSTDGVLAELSPDSTAMANPSWPVSECRQSSRPGAGDMQPPHASAFGLIAKETNRAGEGQGPAPLRLAGGRPQVRL